MSEKYHCEKCDKPLKWCLCHLEDYAKIGDMSACKFLDEQVSYKEGAGSVFFQGWAYKHNQMKFKLNEKDLQIAELDKFVSELMGLIKKSSIDCPFPFVQNELERVMSLDAWKKREK